MHLGVLKRYKLKNGHPLSDTHELVEHTNDEHGDGNIEYVLRVVGVSIPHLNNIKAWAWFALAHF